MENKVSVAKYLVSLIEKTGVRVVPVIQGSAIMKVIDELGQNRNLRYVCPNHEQGLAMMVDAYARIHGFGVGMVTSGPGGMNASTGIACAYYDSIPCMFITGNVGRFHLKGNRGVRQRGFQESDMVSLLKPITKYAVLLENPEDVRYEFEKAFYLAISGRPGPVAIDVPYDVQRAMIDPEKLKGFVPQQNPGEEHGDEELRKAAKSIIEALKNAKRPVLLAGGGVRISGQVDALRRLVKSLRIPVVTTWGGLDFFEPDHPLYLGNIGRSGNRAAVDIVQNCDLLLSLGARFTTKEIVDEKNFAKNARIFSIDIDKSELEEGLIDPVVKVLADLKRFLPILLREAEKSGLRLLDPEKEKILKSAYYIIDATREGTGKEFISPYRFCEALSSVLSPQDIITADVGVNLTWVAQAFRLKEGQRLISAWGCSPMGYAFPAAIGAQLANEKAKVVAILGDGGMQMNIQELQTVFFNKLPIKIFVFNNQCYMSIKAAVVSLFDGRIFGTDKTSGYAPPDFVKVAEAYGIKAVSLEPGEDLKKQIKEVLDAKEPVLVNIPVDPEQYVLDNVDLLPVTPK